jgi:hypothetical protein
MKPDIVDKLRFELREPIQSERQVVYILAELRKLLELESIARSAAGEPADSSYFALRFFCDWSVHVRLDQSGARRIVQRFNQYQKFIEELASRGNAVDPGFLQELDQSLNLTKFREQLGAYLKIHDLDPAIATDDDQWTEFLVYYARVIEDAPLISVGHGLDLVDEVSISIHDERPVGTGDYRIAVKWTWMSKKDGMRQNVVRFF